MLDLLLPPLNRLLPFIITDVDNSHSLSLQTDSRQPSILDKDKVAGHILELAGKTRHSEGLREPPPED